MALLCPLPDGPYVVRLLDQSTVEKLTVDNLAADMKARRQEFGGVHGRFVPSKGFRERGFGDQEPGGEAIA